MTGSAKNPVATWMKGLRGVLRRISRAVALRVLWLATPRPRRPRLDWIALRAEVRRRRAVAAAWIDEQIRLLESRVPGLDRVGVAVDDSCWLSRSGPGHARRGPWYVSATRTVTAVYAVGGPGETRLAGLAAAAGSAGWGYHGCPDPVARLAELLVVPFRARGICEASPGWRPRPGLASPPGWHPPASPGTAVCSVDMSIQAERQTPIRPATGPAFPARLRDRRWPEYPPVPTPFHHPVEWTEADVATLAGRALTRTGQVIAVEITVAYYGR